MVKSLAKQKHTKINVPTTAALTNARSRSSSKCSQIVISTSSGSSSSPGYKKLRTCSRCLSGSGAFTNAADFCAAVSGTISVERIAAGAGVGTTDALSFPNAGSFVNDVLNDGVDDALELELELDDSPLADPRVILTPSSPLPKRNITLSSSSPTTKSSSIDPAHRPSRACARRPFATAIRAVADDRTRSLSCVPAARGARAAAPALGLAHANMCAACA
mmetsp:Transcript_2949/g.6337  ORF Transcript_2949/g.6337 Transcript_2949/m.6337 type:complete len:219 (-) Transcript_2949:36-692(-)